MHKIIRILAEIMDNAIKEEYVISLSEIVVIDLIGVCITISCNIITLRNDLIK